MMTTHTPHWSNVRGCHPDCPACAIEQAAAERAQQPLVQGPILPPPVVSAQGQDRPTWTCAHPEWERHTYTAEDGRNIETCDGWNQSGGARPGHLGLGHMSRCSSWRVLADAQR